MLVPQDRRPRKTLKATEEMRDRKPQKTRQKPKEIRDRRKKDRTADQLHQYNQDSTEPATPRHQQRLCSPGQPACSNRMRAVGLRPSTMCLANRSSKPHNNPCLSLSRAGPGGINTDRPSRWRGPGRPNSNRSMKKASTLAVHDWPENCQTTCRR